MSSTPISAAPAHLVDRRPTRSAGVDVEAGVVSSQIAMSVEEAICRISERFFSPPRSVVQVAVHELRVETERRFIPSISARRTSPRHFDALAARDGLAQEVEDGDAVVTLPDAGSRGKNSAPPPSGPAPLEAAGDVLPLEDDPARDAPVVGAWPAASWPASTSRSRWGPSQWTSPGATDMDTPVEGLVGGSRAD